MVLGLHEAADSTAANCQNAAMDAASGHTASIRRSDPDASASVAAVANRVGLMLHDRGERLTGPRRAVLTVLASSAGHMTVEQVAEQVAALDPSIHLTSVYRSLDAFARLGIVQHVHLGHGTTAYHLVAAAGPHPHAQCRHCRSVWDLPSDVLDEAARRLALDHGFQLDPTHVALSGLCGSCADAEAH